MKLLISKFRLRILNLQNFKFFKIIFKVLRNHKKIIYCSLIIIFLSLPISFQTKEPIVLINEIMYDPSGLDDKREWIEIFNISSNEIDITGWKFCEGGVNHKLTAKQESMVIPPQGYAIIADDTTAFLRDYPDYKGILIDSSFSLKNSEEYLALKNSSLEVVDEITYQSSWGGKGNGKSLERVDGNIWRESFKISGTPGLSNSQRSDQKESSDQEEKEMTKETTKEKEIIKELAPPNFYQVVINEFVPNSEDKKEWIELYNKENLIVDLTGWVIEEGSKSRIVLSDYLEPYGFKIIENIKGKLNNEGDIIILKDASGRIIDKVTYGDFDSENKDGNAPKALISCSLARIKDGFDTDNDSQDFKLTSVLTKNSSNIIIPPETKTKSSDIMAENNFGGIVVINEIYPNPKGSDQKGEFIELKNLGQKEVNLNNWKLSKDESISYSLATKNFSSLTIPAQGFFLLPRKKTSLVLKNKEDTIKLFQSNGQLLDVVSYTEAPEGQSYARDTDAQWKWTTVPTPGKENIIALPNRSPQAVLETKDKVVVGEKITFDASDSFDPDNDPLIYLWDFGDGKKSKEISPIHVFQKEGSFKVSLTVRDNKGLEDKAEKTIIVSLSENTTLSRSSSFILITEFLSNPRGPDVEEEWIEVFNQGEETIDLEGWKLDDSEDGSRPYKISKGTFIQPKQYLVFKRKETKIALNNTFDSVRLIDPYENLIFLIDYKEAKEGTSYARDKDGQWRWTISPTPGKENIFEETEAEDELSEDKLQLSENKSVIETDLDKIFQLEIGTRVKVKGTVSVEPGILSNQVFYLAGSGIQIYSYKRDFPEIKLGDLLEVEGTLSQRGGEKRIKIASGEKIKILGHLGPPLPKKISINEINEKLISSLVVLQGELTEIKKNYFYLDDKGGEIKVYLKFSTNIKRPNFKLGGQVKVTGILSQTKNAWQLLPRYQEDIEIIPVVLAKENPSSSVLPLPISQNKKEVIKYLLLFTVALIVILLGLGLKRIIYLRNKRG